MKVLALALGSLLLVMSCEETAEPRIPVTTQYPMMSTAKESPTTDRFQVEFAGKFRDDLAYDNERRIYIITDRKTKKQYFGISGVGISEIGSHSTDGEGGQAKDER
jgi:hypothetical protein